MNKETKCINRLVRKTEIRTLGFIFFSWFLFGFICLEFNPLNWDITTRALLVIAVVIMQWFDD